MKTGDCFVTTGRRCSTKKQRQAPELACASRQACGTAPESARPKRSKIHLSCPCSGQTVSGRAPHCKSPASESTDPPVAGAPAATPALQLSALDQSGKTEESSRPTTEACGSISRTRSRCSAAATPPAEQPETTTSEATFIAGGVPSRLAPLISRARIASKLASPSKYTVGPPSGGLQGGARLAKEEPSQYLSNTTFQSCIVGLTFGS
mmetsp:Transcript_45681/g.85704  ORF Transcript_45681/g.85704 Transcript_45681/m.85704 type:complete len:208 (+) Transcript_45681:467-1090(+)